MKLSKKLKKVKELQKKVRDNLDDMHEKHRKKFGPMEREAQRIKLSILNEKDSLAKEIRKDVKRFADEMKKKYGELKDLELTYHVLHFGSNAEICVYFEIPLESLIMRKEELEKKKPKKKAKRKKSLKGEKEFQTRNQPDTQTGV